MSFSERLAAVQRRIDKAVALAGAGRNVSLIAVSKFHPALAVQEALDCGVLSFGENRVQEAAEKFPPLRAGHPALQLHLIGALQTNKVAQAVEIFDSIQTLDRPKLADALAKVFATTMQRPRLLVEVNLGREAQKAGVLPEDLDGFLGACRDERGLSIQGLMAIPPFGRDPTPFFRELVAMADRFKLPHRSIGMSDDFEQAIACGATEVRVGTALFGVRQG